MIRREVISQALARIRTLDTLITEISEPLNDAELREIVLILLAERPLNPIALLLAGFVARF
ncbi:hypothetical protein ES705_44575 [subsurface metagenome]